MILGVIDKALSMTSIMSVEWRRLRSGFLVAFLRSCLAGKKKEIPRHVAESPFYGITTNVAVAVMGFATNDGSPIDGIVGLVL